VNLLFVLLRETASIQQRNKQTKPTEIKTSGSKSGPYLVPDRIEVPRLDAALPGELPQLELAEGIALLHDEVAHDQIAGLHQRYHQHLRVVPRALCTRSHVSLGNTIFSLLASDFSILLPRSFRLLVIESKFTGTK
jgi:hypothetical protein